MKTNDYLLIAATAAYSFLFYEQNAGINLLLFSLIMIICFLIRNKDLLRQRNWQWAAALVLVSAASVFVHSSALAVIANIVSLALLSAFSFQPKTSAIFSFLFTVFTFFSSFVYVIIDSVNRAAKSKTEEKTVKSSNGQRILAITIVAVLCLLFFALYQNANPVFAENTKWINLDFVSVKWIAVTLFGFFVAYTLLYHKTILPIQEWEHNLPLQNEQGADENTKRHETERFAGIVLFVFLNLMLLVLNYGDISTIWFHAALPKGVTHSDFVHNGVGIIILSIVIATIVCMYLYRQNYSKVKLSGFLKLLVLLWVVQNLVMLFSTATRNQIYIESFNLTYKRIGVYVWLSLAAFGLVLSALKIVKEKTNWYLVRSNFAVWFTVLSVSSVVNWDLLITRYNLAHQPLNNVDFYYLFSLSDTNIPELVEVTKHKDFQSIQNNLKNFTASRDENYQSNYSRLLSDKVGHFMSDYTHCWQSYDLRDERILHALFKKQ